MIRVNLAIEDGHKRSRRWYFVYLSLVMLVLYLVIDTAQIITAYSRLESEIDQLEMLLAEQHGILAGQEGLAERTPEMDQVRLLLDTLVPRGYAEQLTKIVETVACESLLARVRLLPSGVVEIVGAASSVEGALACMEQLHRSGIPNLREERMEVASDGAVSFVVRSKEGTR